MVITPLIFLIAALAYRSFGDAPPAGNATADGAAPVHCDESANQTMSPCGKCEYMNCEFRHPMMPPPPPCDSCPTAPRPAGCRCKDGFAWHEGICISHDDCPKPCNQSQHMSFMGSPDWHCHPSCSDPHGNKTDPMKCPMVADLPICYCDEGYVRHDTTGDCVKQEKCPK